jgi:hypothetical protein
MACMMVEGVLEASAVGRKAALVADGRAEVAACFRTALSAWKTSDGMRRRLGEGGGPRGMIMNSWKSIGASECAPPLMMLAIGMGRVFALGPPR